jgi:hypothetical protein
MRHQWMSWQQGTQSLLSSVAMNVLKECCSIYWVLGYPQRYNRNVGFPVISLPVKWLHWRARVCCSCLKLISLTFWGRFCTAYNSYVSFNESFKPVVASIGFWALLRDTTEMLAFQSFPHQRIDCTEEAGSAVLPRNWFCWCLEAGCVLLMIHM